LLILFVAVMLRLILALHGGQSYFPDENRYLSSIQFLNLWLKGDFFQSMTFLSTVHAHPMYVVVSAALQYLSYIALNLSFPTHIEWDFVYSPNSMKFSAFCLSIFSVVSIFLVYKIAERTGAEKRESLMAACLMGCSNSIFYFSRHLLPYDIAMAFALLALWIGLKKGSGLRTSFLCGIIAGFASMLYYGIFILSLTAIFFNIFIGSKNILRVALKAMANAAGFLMIPCLLIIFGVVMGKGNALSELVDFFGTVNQGTFSEGWSFPWEYLWHSEHLLLFLWFLAILVVLGFGFLKRFQSALFFRAVKWLAAIIIYIIFGFFSVTLHKFVIYGRAVRQMVPFFCLLTACAFEMSGIFQRSKILLSGVLILILIQTAINFKTPLLLRFPPEVQEDISRKYGWVKQSISIVGHPLSKDIISNPFSGYVLLNAQSDFFPVLGSYNHVEGKVLYRTKHPLEFLPYQYEGYTPIQRTILRSTDISIRLLKIDNNLITNLFFRQQ